MHHFKASFTRHDFFTALIFVLTAIFLTSSLAFWSGVTRRSIRTWCDLQRLVSRQIINNYSQSECRQYLKGNGEEKYNKHTRHVMSLQRTSSPCSQHALIQSHKIARQFGNSSMQPIAIHPLVHVPLTDCVSRDTPLPVSHVDRTSARLTITGQQVVYGRVNPVSTWQLYKSCSLNLA